MSLEQREANKDCRILALKNGDAKNDIEKWTAYFDWFCYMGIKLRNIALKHAQ